MSAERFDLVIVGAGIAGMALAAAVMQRHTDWRVALLEKDPSPALGPSGQAAAFLCLTYPDTIRRRLAERAHALLEQQDREPRSPLRLARVGGVHWRGVAALEEPREALFNAYLFADLMWYRAHYGGVIFHFRQAMQGWETERGAVTAAYGSTARWPCDRLVLATGVDSVAWWRAARTEDGSAAAPGALQPVHVARIPVHWPAGSAGAAEGHLLVDEDV